MSSVYFYRKGIDSNQEINIKRYLIKEISWGNYFLLNEEDKEFLLMFEKGEYIQVLPYERHESIMESIKDEPEKQKYIELIKMDTEKGTLEFYADSEDCYILRTSITLESSIPIDTNSMPFFKDEYDYYRDYDIEWVGDHYQVTDYLTRRLVSTEPSLKDVYKDIDNFLIWKNKISTDVNYYKEKGFKIRVIPSPRGYPAFPFSYEIELEDGNVISYYGIGNVFDTEEEAALKACYVANDLINNN